MKRRGLALFRISDLAFWGCGFQSWLWDVGAGRVESTLVGMGGPEQEDGEILRKSEGATGDVDENAGFGTLL